VIGEPLKNAGFFYLADAILTIHASPFTTF